MGGYSSTPRKGKTSEEGTIEELSYAASGMQGWRASMEDAHIALLRVPHGRAPSSAEIGAARIGISSQADKSPVRMAVTANIPNGGATAATSAAGARGRAGTFSAGDGGERFPPRQPRQGGEGTVAATGSGGASTGACVEEGGGAGGGSGGEGGRGESSPGAGWKAVDLLEDAALFGVFDGHGGKSVAEFCKERLPGLLAASPEIRAGNWKEGFPRVYHALDELLLSGEGQEKSGGWGGSSRVDGVGVGCTIVTALLDRKRRQCYVAHAGDSRCVLCRAGRAVQLTRDHKPGLPSEYARIVAAGGHVSRVGRVNDNLNLSRAIGDMSYKRNRLRRTKDQIISAEPDVCRFTVTPGVDEFLLLACDGVWEMMDTTQVVAFVRSGLRAGTPPVEVCESLLDACLSPDPRGTRYAGCDNMTVVLVLLEGWEAALATKAYTPGLTFCGGRLGGVAEAAAALSATLPTMPRKLSNVRPPLPTEFRAVKRPSPPSAAGGSAAAAATTTTIVAATATPTATAVATAAPTISSPSAAATTAAVTGASTATADRPRGERDVTLPAMSDASAIGSDNSTGAGAGTAAGEKDVDTMSWPQRRIAAGKVAPPRTAHGIEFALASFTPPVLPIGYALRSGSRASTGRIRHDTGAAGAPGGQPMAGTRPRSSSQIPSPSNSALRRNPHMRSATAPMLPSPLLHHRRPPPSEERLAAAAAIAVLGDVGAAGAVAAAAAAEDDATSTYRHPAGINTGNGRPARAQLDLLAEVSAANTGEGVGRQAAPSEDAGLVYVPTPDEMTPAEVTVTAKASPPRAQHSE